MPIIGQGYLGVQLFFLISGFVILMTLERSPGILQFVWRRWLRLFPAMAICTLFIYLAASTIPGMPEGTPSLPDAIPGLIFIFPTAWRAVGLHVRSLDGAFWSLYVEVHFYLIAATLYYGLGKHAMLAGIFIVGAVTLGALVLEPSSQLMTNGWSLGEQGISVWLILRGGFALFAKMLALLGGQYFVWFFAGACSYIYYNERRIGYLFLAVAAVIALTFVNAKWTAADRVVLCCLYLLFFGGLLSGRVRSVLSFWPLVGIGYISYPLYLVHQNIVVAATTQLAATDLGLLFLPFLSPILPIFAVALLAWIIASQGEPRLQRSLQAALGAGYSAPRK